MTCIYTRKIFDESIPTHLIEFWIKDKEGYTRKSLIRFPANYSEEELLYELRLWCLQFPAFVGNESDYTSGYNVID